MRNPLNEEDSSSVIARRYNRVAWLYDAYDAPMELLGTRNRRKRLIGLAHGRILEAGVGTGKNLPFYGSDCEITGIDISEGMLKRARKRMKALDIRPDLRTADVTALEFPDDHFDTSVATCVFCSVFDPVAGLKELARVTRPDGLVLLLEHVRPESPILGWIADALTPVTRRVFGFRANRRTVENVEAAGLRLLEVRRLGIWREIVARPPKPGPKPLDIPVEWNV